MLKVITPALVFLSTISLAIPAQNLKEGSCDAKNAVCIRAKPESPLARAGIKQGDVLLSVNGIKLTDPKKGLEAFRALNESKRTVMRVIRYGKEQTIIHEPK